VNKHAIYIKTIQFISLEEEIEGQEKRENILKV